MLQYSTSDSVGFRKLSELELSSVCGGSDEIVVYLPKNNPNLGSLLYVPNQVSGDGGAGGCGAFNFFPMGKTSS